MPSIEEIYVILAVCALSGNEGIHAKVGEALFTASPPHYSNLRFITGKSHTVLETSYHNNSQWCKTLQQCLEM
jgi:hypothetical protein